MVWATPAGDRSSIFYGGGAPRAPNAAAALGAPVAAGAPRSGFPRFIGAARDADRRLVAVQREEWLHRGPPLAGRRAGRGLLQRLHQPLPLGDARARRDVRGERAREVEAALQLDDHDETAAEQVDVETLDAGTAQALDDLGPHVTMMLAVGRDGRGIVHEIRRQYMSIRHTTSTPPSIGYACPVMNDASSEQRYSARNATSSDVPMRPIG